MVKAGLALQRRLAAGGAVLRQCHREQGIAHRPALPQRAAAAARTFEIAGSEIDALRDGAVDLALVETAELGGGDRGAKDAEDRPGMKAARHDRRDEFGRHPLHHLIAGSDRDEKIAAGGARNFGRGQCRRQDRGAGVGQHAEGVPFAAGENRLRVDKGGTRLGQLGAVAQHRRGPAAARFFLQHQRQGLFARGHVVGDQCRGQCLQRDAFGAVDDRRRQVQVFEAGDKPGKLAAQRHDASSPQQRPPELRAVSG